MDRNLLARATEGTDAPTPGYLYLDLTKAASLNPTAAHDMAQYLTRRLSNKQNPNIKYKCLKVMEKLCVAVPRHSFRRALSQDTTHMAAIKSAVQFRGPLDPVHGDAKNEKVRQAAKACLEAVYSETTTDGHHAAGFSGGGGGGAMPSSMMNSTYGPPSSSSSSAAAAGNYYGPSGSSGGQPRRMDGVGNPMFQDPRHDPRYNGSHAPTNIKDHLKEAGDIVMGMIKDPLARGADIPPPLPRQGHSGELPGYGHNNRTYGRPPPGQSELSRQTNGQWTMASNRGPGAIQNYSNGHVGAVGGVPSTPVSGQVGGSWASASSPSAAAPPHHMMGPARESAYGATPPSVYVTNGGGGGGGGVTDGTYEKNMVLELCPPGGMKPVPPPDKLAAFAKVVSGLNPDLICPVVLDCLEDGQPWIIRAKALCVMEMALQHGGRPYVSFFHACQDEIVPLASHPRAAIKEPARRCLQLLGVPVEGSAAAAAAPTRYTAPAPNLLDFDDDDDDGAPAASAAAAAPEPGPALAAAAPSAPPANDMFGGMQVKAASGATTTPAKPTPAPTSGNLLDFMSADDTAASPAGAATNNVFRESSGAEPPSSMFDQVTLKNEDKKTTDSQEDTASNAGSAFGFINDTTADTSKTKQQPANFDPLQYLNGSSGGSGSTPTSAEKKVMQLSPEQMQAMAYQQMMMQQQMMQQAALQQQQRGTNGLPMFYPPMAAMPMTTAQRQGSHGSMNSNNAGASFGFMNNNNNAARPQQKDDKKFDFVKDAMMRSHSNKK